MVYDDGTAAAVVDVIGVVLRLEPGVDRQGHRADLDAAQEQRLEVETVHDAEHDPVAGADAERPQIAAGLAHPGLERAVGHDRPVRIVEEKRRPAGMTGRAGHLEEIVDDVPDRGLPGNGRTQHCGAPGDRHSPAPGRSVGLFYVYVNIESVTGLPASRPKAVPRPGKRPGWECACPVGLRGKSGAPGKIRTPNLLIRSQVLYPVELRALPAQALEPRTMTGVRADSAGAGAAVANSGQVMVFSHCPPRWKGARHRGRKFAAPARRDARSRCPVAMPGRDARLRWPRGPGKRSGLTGRLRAWCSKC